MIKKTINRIVARRRLNSDYSTIYLSEALAALEATKRANRAKFVQMINPVYISKA